MTAKKKIRKQMLMNLAMQDQTICICQQCGTVYKPRLLKPGENFNDFGIRFCHYCGALTESFPDWVTMKKSTMKNTMVLITISGGLIDQVKFYNNSLQAVNALSNFVQAMNLEDADAGIYDKNGLIANAKDFLDSHDEFIKNLRVFERI